MKASREACEAAALLAVAVSNHLFHHAAALCGRLIGREGPAPPDSSAGILACHVCLSCSLEL